jgi:hypothetical protein
MGKEVRCTFDYMVKLGRITIEQANLKLKLHQQECNRFDPQCQANLKSYKHPKRCCNLKAGRNEFYCLKHIKEQLQPMDLSDD